MHACKDSKDYNNIKYQLEINLGSGKPRAIHPTKKILPVFSVWCAICDIVVRIAIIIINGN